MKAWELKGASRRRVSKICGARVLVVGIYHRLGDEAEQKAKT